ncbi:MAG: hypothetical protein ABIO81_13405 [Ginsengibacter sp.]
MSASHSFAQNNNTNLQTDTAFAPDSISSPEEIVEDTLISKATFEAGNDSLEKWKHSRDFSYIIYLDSLLKKEKGLKTDTVSMDVSTGKKRRVVTSSKESNSNNFLNSLPLKIFFWAVAISFIGFIIYRLFLADGLFTKKNLKVNKENVESEPAGLDEYSKYNDLILDAESKNDYNLSTRYLYLQTLKMLADRELILYSPDKTNNSYVKELSTQVYRCDFVSLTLNYEYVWYGKFLITWDQYRHLKDQFNSFNKKV